MAGKNGKLVTVFSTKGGVGKTIFTLNLAAAYQFLDKKVLIIDLDLYSGGIALSLNVTQNKDIFTLVDDLNNNRYTEFKDYVIKYNNNIDVLACPKDPRQGSKIESKYVEIIMATCSSKYDVVLIDTSHILNDINLMALDKTDQIVLLFTNDPVDLKNVKSIVSIFKDSEIDNYKLVLNNAINVERDVFTLFDIKNIISDNIDYIIDHNFYVKNIDKYTLNGEPVFLNNKMRRRKKHVFNHFKKMAVSFIEDKGGSN